MSKTLNKVRLAAANDTASSIVSGILTFAMAFAATSAVVVVAHQLWLVISL